MRLAAATARSRDEAAPARPSVGGWCADLRLRYARRGARTVLAARSQRGPLLVQRPFYPEGDVCHTLILHPPAGIVGGDQLSLSLELEPNAHSLLTTPAATRWYFSRGVEARLEQRAIVAERAAFEWLPQETLLFAGAHARATTRIELHGDASACGWEILGLGRPSCDETFRDGRADMRFEIFRDGRPLLLERLRAGADGVPGMRGHGACGTFIATAADASVLAEVREQLGGVEAVRCAATLIDRLLVVRGLAAHCEPLREMFTHVWSRVRPLVLGRVASPPRIWHT